MVTKKRSSNSLAKVEPRAQGTAKAPSIAASDTKIRVVHPRIEFIKNVKFVGLGLDQTSSYLDRIALAKARQEEAELELDLKINQSVLTHEDDHFVVRADFTLIQTTKKSDKPIISIAATFSARFNLSTPASEELVRGFAVVEARLIFFPYIRHFVSDTTYRMTNEPIVLPLTSELER